MTKEEAETVTKRCDENSLLRPATQESRGEVTLTWYPSFNQPAFTTGVYKSARHWCKIMQLEHEAGVMGYSRTYEKKGKYD